MKILVTFAVDMEFAAWRRQHGFREIAREPFPLYTANIGGNSVRVVLTGIGTAAAARALPWALESPADLCISSGFAGALHPALIIGEVMAARVVHRAEHDLAVASDQELFSAAGDTGAQTVERFLTSERLVGSASEKAALAAVADAVEMESFIVLAEAARHGVRAAAIRAVSDTAATSLPYDFDRICDERGRLRMGALLGEVLRHPQGIPQLLRLGRDSRTASRNLAAFLDEYIYLLQARLDLSQSEMLTAQ